MYYNTSTKSTPFAFKKEEVHMKKSECKNTNIEKFINFAEKEDEELLPLFIALLEMCFQSEKHSLQKL